MASLGLKYHRLRASGPWASSQTSWLIKAASLLASAESSRTWSTLLHQQEDDGIFSPPPACPSTYEAVTWGRQVQGDPPWACGKARVSKICLRRTQTAKPLEQDWPGVKEKSHLLDEYLRSTNTVQGTILRAGGRAVNGAPSQGSHDVNSGGEGGIKRAFPFVCFPFTPVTLVT